MSFDGPDCLIHAEGLCKSYKNIVFENISLTLRRGEAIGVIGPNGSGKTTLLNVLAGLDRPGAGHIEVNGKIGYVMQKAGLFTRLSCLDNMRYVAALNGLSRSATAQRIDECAAFCGVADFLRKKAGQCSGGMQQRLNIAMAMIAEPDILLLDEAAAGLDDASREGLRNVLRTLVGQSEGVGVGIVMVSHDRAELSGLCKQTLNMETGRVVYA